MVHDAKTATEKNTADIGQFIKLDPALLATPNNDEPKNITVARQVVLWVIRKFSVLVFTKAAGLVEVTPHEKVGKNHVYMTTKGIMDVYPLRTYYITTANFGKVHEHF